MFSIGQLVVYGGEGVCRVEGIGAAKIAGADPTRQYYTLSPLFRTGQVMTPVDTQVLMRPLMTAQAAQALIERLNELEPEEMPSGGSRTAKEYYHELMMSYDCRRLACFLKAAGRRRVQARQSGKKASQMDERYVKRAEEHLYGELGAALNIPCHQMSDYIRRTYPAWPEG